MASLAWILFIYITVMAGGRLFGTGLNIFLILYFYVCLRGIGCRNESPTVQARLGRFFYVSQDVSTAKIEGFCHPPKITSPKPKPDRTSIRFKKACRLVINATFSTFLILLANDVEIQPGPGVIPTTIPQVRGFKVAHLNVRSMVNKMDDIRMLIKEKPFEIFTISETWLNTSIADSEIEIPGYTFARKDRGNGSRGGGTLVFVRDGIPYKHCEDLKTVSLETCWVEVTRPKCKKLIICCAYRPPTASIDSGIDELNSLLPSLPPDAEFILLGDFNINFLSSKSDPDRKQKRKIMHFANMHNLEQLITTPTRISESSQSIIDLLFVNNSQRIVQSGVIVSTISDHFLVYCTIKSGVPKAQPRVIEYRSYKSYDKKKFIDDLKNVNWDAIVEQPDLNSVVSTWNKLFSGVADQHAPIKRNRVKGIPIPWMTPKLSQAMRDRDYYHRRAVKSKSLAHWKTYRKLRLFVNKEVKRCKSEYYQNLIEKNRGNPAELWKTLNAVTSRKSTSRPTCIITDGVTSTEPLSIAKALNVHFTTIGTKLAVYFTSIPNYFRTNSSSTAQCSENLFNFQPVDEIFVRNQLQHLKTNKAIGLDNISARLLKDASIVITPSLTNIFNRSLQSSVYPSIWKMGKVTAIFKSGNRSDPNNYRPITILPTLSKILERAAHQQLYSYLNENHKLTSKQFGFRPKLSTEVALVHFTDTILKDMDSGLVTGVAFLDLSKAFDTVNHNILVHKLSCIGLSTNTTNWFRSYLMNRCQVTAIENNLSSCQPVPLGVPQGSILGPLLFLIYVNDLPNFIEKCEISLYADDTVIHCSSTSVTEIEVNLNSDLARVADWLNNNHLTLNSTKSKFMLIGSAQKLKSCNEIVLMVNDTELDHADTMKYLGVTFNRNLTWSNHVENLIKKINQRIGLLRRVKHLIPQRECITLYNTLILPLMDYGNLVWGDKENITLMDSVQVCQNKTAKIILGLPSHSSASAALQSLDWIPLNLRRKFNRCIYVYKYLHNLIDFDFQLQLNADVHDHNTRRRKDFHLPRVKRKWGKQRFTYHALQDWNSLNQHIRESTSLSLFKNNLKNLS